MKLEKYENLPKEIVDIIDNDANLFFSKEYVNYVRAEKEELYFAFDRERIMPIRHRKKYIFNFAVLLSEPHCLVQVPRTDLREFLDNVMVLLARTLHVQWAHTTASGLFAETTSFKCKRIPFGSHVVDLTQSEEELWKAIHSKHKNVIRKAEKENIVIQAGSQEMLSDYVNLEKETSERTGRSASGRDYYKKQLDYLGRKIRIYIAYKDDNPQAGGIFYYNKSCCYYMYGATGKYAINGSANKLIWKAMLDMKLNGVKRFSFVGCRINEDIDSKYHGIQRFKERFGGKLELGYMFRYEESSLLYYLFCKVMQYRLHMNSIYKDPIDGEIDKWSNQQIKTK